MTKTAPVDFDVPPPETQIWRYMDVTKFLSMLQTSALFFPRSSSFSDDPFEGSLPRRTAEAYKSEFGALPGAHPAKAQEQRALMDEAFRHWVFVNCWHINSHESAGMWKLYARSNEAVAIVSTVGRLAACLPKGSDWTYPRIGRVRYVDYEAAEFPIGNTYWRFLHKRESFKHEQELRVISIQPVMKDCGVGHELVLDAPTKPGVSFKVDLNDLIDRVRLAPTCPPWVSDAVIEVAARFGLTSPVERSSLDATPLY